MVIEERTGAPACLRLASTSLLALFAQSQPQPGERIDVRYRWHTPDHGYQRWRPSSTAQRRWIFPPSVGKRPTKRPGTRRGAWPSLSQGPLNRHRRLHDPAHQAALDASGRRPPGDPFEAVTHRNTCLVQGKCADAMATCAVDHEERNDTDATICGECFRSCD
jgi:hypothetical protein